MCKLAFIGISDGCSDITLSFRSSSLAKYSHRLLSTSALVGSAKTVAHLKNSCLSNLLQTGGTEQHTRNNGTVRTHPLLKNMCPIA